MPAPRPSTELRSSQTPRRRRGLAALVALALFGAGCSQSSDAHSDSAGSPENAAAAAAETTTTSAGPTSSSPIGSIEFETVADEDGALPSNVWPEELVSDEDTDDGEPALLAGGVDPRTLVTTPDGAVIVQPTPEPLRNRALATTDTLPPPSDDVFEATSAPLAGGPLARSTWHGGCPTSHSDLTYVTVSFWGFDDLPHTGELIVANEEAEKIISVFEQLFDARFPIEEMRITTDDDLEAIHTGDDNNTSSYVCRPVTGGTEFSQHAHGLAIDINPFQNPYERDGVVLPELSSAYLDRSEVRPGMIFADGVVVAAFESIGWFWGGNWTSLSDYHHFSANNR